MPSVSKKQHNFMEAVAHSPAFAKKAGVPQSVGKDFAAADKKSQSFEHGGLVMANKGYSGRSETFAKGGDVLGRVKDFMKTPNRFLESGADGRFQPKPEPTEDNFGKQGGRNEAPPAHGKSLKAVVPRS